MNFLLLPILLNSYQVRWVIKKWLTNKWWRMMQWELLAMNLRKVWMCRCGPYLDRLKALLDRIQTHSKFWKPHCICASQFLGLKTPQHRLYAAARHELEVAQQWVDYVSTLQAIHCLRHTCRLPNLCTWWSRTVNQRHRNKELWSNLQSGNSRASMNVSGCSFSFLDLAGQRRVYSKKTCKQNLSVQTLWCAQKDTHKISSSMLTFPVYTVSQWQQWPISAKHCYADLLDHPSSCTSRKFSWVGSSAPLNLLCHIEYAAWCPRSFSSSEQHTRIPTYR